MATLTLAELMHYPGLDLTEKARAHHHEHRLASPAKPRSVVRTLDLRPFPGRTRLERAKGYLCAHFPRARDWSDEALDELAARLLHTAEIID